jgi:phage FluMu protein Com
LATAIFVFDQFMVSDRHDVRLRYTPKPQSVQVQSQFQIKCGHCFVVLQAPPNAEYFTCPSCNEISQIPTRIQQDIQAAMIAKESNLKDNHPSHSDKSNQLTLW